jgi:tetratricopeptide (TPR) repeat protein
MRRRLTPPSRGWIAALAALAVVGCASPKLAYSPELLRSQVRALAPGLPESEIIVPFEVQPEQIATARRATRHFSDAHQKALALARSLGNPKWFGLRYQWANSGSAAETFASGAGNCLALSSTFIGLARGIGLDAYYIDATRVPERREDGEIIVSAGHIGVAVPTSGGVTLVDFAGEMRAYSSFRHIDDMEALAHLYNNRGYEVIHRAQRGAESVPWQEARKYFELARQISPDFALAWNNLGIAEGRLGNPEEAERTYRGAIAIDPNLSSAYLNLGNLYLENGNLEAALVDLQAAARLDRRNPFVHYLRGVALARSGALADAEKALKRSIRLKDDYADAHALLAEVRRELAAEPQGIQRAN